MFVFPVRWDKIALKEGDDLNLVVSPVQRALLIGVLLNYQFIGENAPDTMRIGEDKDNFDAVISDIMSKLSITE